MRNQFGVFEVGDRVVVIEHASPDTQVGQVGTVLEISLAPWVAFDEPTTYRPGMQLPIPGWKVGHMDCIPFHALDPHEDGKSH